MQSGALSCTCCTWVRVYDSAACICREFTSKMVEIFDECHSNWGLEQIRGVHTNVFRGISYWNAYAEATARKI